MPLENPALVDLVLEFEERLTEVRNHATILAVFLPPVVGEYYSAEGPVANPVELTVPRS